jgi:hypothetical protein
MSTNQIENPKQGPNCKCGGTTWERLDDSGHYWQCEMCGECVDVEQRDERYDAEQDAIDDEIMALGDDF